MLIIKLKNWSERPDDEDYITSVISEIYRRTANVHSAKLFAFAQPTIMGYSTGSGVELYVQDRAGGSIETLKEQVHCRPQRPSGGADGLYDVRHQVPAISGRGGCRSTFCPAVPTCARLRQT